MYTRQRIVDHSDFSIKQINDNFSALFLKISGNIDTIDLKDSAITTSKIKDGAVTAEKIVTGSINVGHLDSEFILNFPLLDNPTFISYSENIDNNFSQQATLIQQNGEQISLHATKIDGINTDVSSLSVRADEIETNVGNLTTTVTTNYDNLTGEISSLSTIVTKNHSSITQRADRIESNVSSISTDVSSLDSRVSSHSSQITQLSNSISSKVSYTDYNGNTIASMINQSATTVSINASKIDLTGITTIYSNDGNSYTTMGGSYSDFKIVDNGYTIFEVRNELAGAISLKSYGSEFLATRGSSTSPLGTWDFSSADVKNLNVIAKFA